MGGRKSAGRGGRGGRGRGSSGGRARGRGGGGYGGGGRGGWGGEARQGHRGGGIYGPPESERLSFVGDGPKRKHRQMRDAYGPRAGGRRVRRPDDYDTDTSDDDPDHLSEYVTDDSEDQPDADDPNVDDARVMRVGGIEIRLDRGADDREDPRGTPVQPRALSDDDSDDDDDDDWGSELSLDDDAVADYMQNCMNDDDDDDENESGAAAAFGGDDAPMDPTAAAERRRARQAAYLAGMRAMRLDAGDVPSPPLSLSGSDSDSEAENDALVNGNYGAYSWSRGAGAGGSRRDPERLGPSGKRAAKKAAKAARRRGESPDVDESLPRPAVVAEMLRMMILSGGSYVGFQPARSASALRGLARIADAFGLRAELRGGGKRRHPVVVWTPRARVPRADDQRVARAVAEAGGGEYRPGGNWEGYAADGREGGRDGDGDGDRDFASNFVSGGVMRHDDDDDDDDDEGDGGDGRWRRRRTRLRRTGRMRRWIVPFASVGMGRKTTTRWKTTTAWSTRRPPRTSGRMRSGSARAHPPPRSRIAGFDARRRRLSARDERSSRVGGSWASRPGAGRRSRRGKRNGWLPRVTDSASLRSTHPASGVGCSPRWASRGRARAWGKGGTGIAEPITAEVRARRVGLGADRR